MTTIGPSFAGELSAKGLLTTVVVQWDADGDITYAPGATADQIGQVEAVVAAHDSTKPAVPTQVPMWAAQAALKAAGEYDAVNAAIVGNATASPPVASMEATNAPVYFAWTMGNYASRQSAFIDALAGEFSMTSAQIDAIFIAANQIATAAG